MAAPSRVLPDPDVRFEIVQALKQLRGLVSVGHQELCELESEVERQRCAMLVLRQRLERIIGALEKGGAS